MVKEKIERRGAKVWSPKNRVTTTSIPQTKEKRTNGTKRKKERRSRGRGSDFMRADYGGRMAS
jgi:hypothetical protein